VSRRDEIWLADVLAAIDAITDYLTQGSLDDGLIYDACRARLIEIGEAVKHLDPDLLAKAPEIPWRPIARMRDQLAHHYFDTDHAIVTQAVTEELGPLRAAIVLLAVSASGPDSDPKSPSP